MDLIDILQKLPWKRGWENCMLDLFYTKFDASLMWKVI